MELVLAGRALADEPCPGRDLPSQGGRSVIGGPHRRQETAGQQTGQNAGIDLVGLGPPGGEPADGLGIGQHAVLVPEAPVIGAVPA
jgi:hypothetical protein